MKITQTAVLYPDGNFDFHQYPPQPLNPQQMRNMYKNNSAEKDPNDGYQAPYYNPVADENRYPNQNEVNQNYYNPYMYLNQQAIGGHNPNHFRG